MPDHYQSLVDDFINTDLSIMECLRKPQYKGDLFIETLIQLNSINMNSNREEIDATLKEAERIDRLEFNPLAKSIFYMGWSSASIQLGLKDQALFIKDKALRVLPPNSPPIFISTFEAIGAFLKNNKMGFSQKLIEDYEKFKHTSKRYQRNLNLFLNNKCSQGMAYSENREENYLIKYRSEIPEKDIMYYTYQNDVVICNFVDIQKYFNEIINYTFLGLSHFIYYFLAKGEIKPELLNEKPKIKEQLEHLSKINLYIMQKEINKAIKEFNKDYCSTVWQLEVYFFHYTQIRLELINRNAEAAFQLLKDKKSLGYFHYYDNFFMARLELLRGNHEKAHAYFKQFASEMTKHNSLQLFKLELNLAYEMKASDIFDFAKITNKDTKKNENIESAIKMEEKFGVNKIEGTSEDIHKIKTNIKNFCNAEMPILILGETGVGKEIIARAIHEESNRKQNPFVAINCSAIADSLLQSELFGHTEGAYTGATKEHKGIFQAAGNGTVFLDEIGDISPAIQVALLRVLENKEVRPIGSAKTITFNCQIIAATNANLEMLVAQKLFREDLYYRLNRLTIIIPPLRNRRDDIVPLANFFLKSCRNTFETPILSEDLKTALTQFEWPGNIRQLKNEILKMDLIHSRKTFYDINDCEFLNKITLNPNLPSEPATAAPSKLLVNKLKKSSQRHRLVAIKQLFEEQQELTRMQIAEKLEISLPTVTTDLKALCDEKFIVKIKPSKSPRSHYFTIHK